jgi:hypothetical protein
LSNTAERWARAVEIAGPLIGGREAVRGINEAIRSGLETQGAEISSDFGRDLDRGEMGWYLELNFDQPCVRIWYQI